MKRPTQTNNPAVKDGRQAEHRRSQATRGHQLQTSCPVRKIRLLSTCVRRTSYQRVQLSGQATVRIEQHYRRVEQRGERRGRRREENAGENEEHDEKIDGEAKVKTTNECMQRDPVTVDDGRNEESDAQRARGKSAATAPAMVEW